MTTPTCTKHAHGRVMPAQAPCKIEGCDQSRETATCQCCAGSCDIPACHPTHRQEKGWVNGVRPRDVDALLDGRIFCWECACEPECMRVEASAPPCAPAASSCGGPADPAGVVAAGSCAGDFEEMRLW